MWWSPIEVAILREWTSYEIKWYLPHFKLWRDNTVDCPDIPKGDISQITLQEIIEFLDNAANTLGPALAERQARNVAEMEALERQKMLGRGERWHGSCSEWLLKDERAGNLFCRITFHSCWSFFLLNSVSTMVNGSAGRPQHEQESKPDLDLCTKALDTVSFRA
jgi:hypothetical protein